MTPTHLKSLQALEIAARTGSFTAAGDLLGITPAAVGQRVKALEDYLGVTLLDRHRAGISPTQELAKALPDLAAGFAAIAAAATTLDLERPHEIHVAASPDFAELWLEPRLAGFRAMHPNVRFCINGEGDAPLRLGRVDCKVTFEAPRDDASCDLLFHDFVLPITSPENFERTRSVPGDLLEGFPLLHGDFYKDDPAGISWPRWCTANAVIRTAPERGMRFRRIASLVGAVTADAGVALCGVALIADMVDRGDVAMPFPIASGQMSQLGFVASYAGGPGRTIGRFRAWLRDEARATADWTATFRGRG